MATNAKRGLDIKISIGEQFLAGQRGATLNRSAETIDITNKVSAGWKEIITSVKEWSIDCDGVFVADDAALKALETAFNANTVVDVKISDGTWGYKGKAIITDFPIEAPYDDAATYSITLQGTGELQSAAPGRENA